MSGRLNGAPGGPPAGAPSRIVADLLAANPEAARRHRRRRRAEAHIPAVQEIMGPVPGRVLHWGIPLIGLALALVLLAAWVIRYPQLLTARITVTTGAPPAPVVSRTAGPLVLLVDDLARVEAGAHLAYVDGATRYGDVARLKAALEEVRPRILGDAGDLGFRPLPSGAVLGELAEPYARFVQAYRDEESFSESPLHRLRLETLREEEAARAALRERLLRTRSLMEREMALAAREHEVQQRLFAGGHVSASELTRTEREYLRAANAVEQVGSTLAADDLQRLQQLAAAAEWRHEHEEGRRARRLALRSAFHELESRLLAWEERVLLRAPVAGIVSFFRFWSDHQPVAAGEEVMTIVPSGTGARLLGRAYLPQAGAGRVRAGQAVRVRFDSHPADEFGVVAGRVEAVSLVARDERYLLEVGFPDGLRTSLRDSLPFRPEMQGTAEVVTRDRRLVEHIFSGILSRLEGR